MTKTGRTALTLLLIIIVTLTLAGGCLFGPATKPTTTVTTAERAAIGEVWDIIFNDYVDQSKLDAANLSQAAIEGMIEALDDPYTWYVDPETYILSQAYLQGSYEGIGAYVTVKDGQITIIAPIDGSPADQAGIKAGDIILEIDGESVEGMSLDEAIIKIRGPAGTTVKLLVQHEGEAEPMEIEVVRAALEIASVNYEMRGETAYIRITDFTTRTPEELDAALESLKDEKATGIVLDLRGNPGGLLEALVDVASSFIGDGIVLMSRSNQGEITTYEVKKGRSRTDLPMVCLVDNDSASASEVLAGALQDHGRAVIAGVTTYGKGSINALYPLGDGSGLFITVARWLTPNGRLIEGQGIAPDITLEVTGEEAVQWAIDYLNGTS
jgi:carboxyl-terminal processing protease